MSPQEQALPADTTTVILARMEVKLDHALEDSKDHETRIRALERKVWVASGVVALLSSGLTTAVSNALGK